MPTVETEKEQIAKATILAEALQILEATPPGSFTDSHSAGEMDAYKDMAASLLFKYWIRAFSDTTRKLAGGSIGYE